MAGRAAIDALVVNLIRSLWGKDAAAYRLARQSIRYPKLAYRRPLTRLASVAARRSPKPKRRPA